MKKKKIGKYGKIWKNMENMEIYGKLWKIMERN